MQAVVALLAGLAFIPVHICLLYQIGKIYRRGTSPHITPLLMVAHFGRWGGWALVGAAIITVDPVTGWMLVLSRSLGFVLISVVLLQRKKARPRLQELALTALGTLAGLSAACAVLMYFPTSKKLTIVLEVFVAICFIVLLLYALPKQICTAYRKGTFGLLRWFQSALFGSYVLQLLYSFYVLEDSIRVLMLVVYSLAVLLQGIFVCQIEIGRVQWRAKRKE